MMQSVTIAQLQKELDAFSDEFHTISEDNLFVAWFLRAYLADTDQAAIDALTGGPGDKGIDAVLVDDKADVVYVVQAKYRHKRPAKSEDRASVIHFAQIAQTIYDPSSAVFAEFLKGMDPATASALKDTRHRVLKKGYRLILIFVTLGKCSPTAERDAKQAVRRASKQCTIEILDGRRCLTLLQDYLDGAAPPIPTLNIPIESGGGVKVPGILNRFDTQNELESWVFPVRGDSIASMFEQGGHRLFARNIRGFLGEATAVNRDMLATIRSTPSLFFYFNNGVTIICDHAERVTHRGTDVLQVSNPQVINGQQTSRVLAEDPQSRNASVLVKVIQVPRDPTSSNKHFDGLIGKIVQATNWQNVIKQADLMSNDRRQLAIEKAFRHRDYFYLRKKQTKREIRAAMRGKKYKLISKEELAQAVAGCDLDPTVARSGKDNLFGEQLYDQVFPTASADYYLPRYWLFRQVTRGAKGIPQRGYAKWLVLGFLWNQLSTLLRKQKQAALFSKLCRAQDPKLARFLERATRSVYVQALAYYRANRGRGESQVDISQFFRSKKGRDREFAAFWMKLPRSHRAALTAHLENLQTILTAEK